MGAASTGMILEKNERIVLSISGHSHVRNHISVGSISAVTVPLGYGPEHLERFVQDAVAIIDIEQGNVNLSHFVEGDLSIGLTYVSARD